MENAIDRKKAARSAFIRSSAFQRLIIIAVLILLYGYFYAASTSFRKYTTLVQICSNMYYTLLMAIGVTFPLITGGNDLSMGTGLICYSLIGSYLMRICGWPLWAAILITIAMGIGMGAVNGFGVAKLDVPPFIMTLASMMFCRGIGSILTGGFSGTWPDGAEPGAGFRNAFRLIVKTESGRMPIPLGMVWMILLVIIMTLVLNKTRVGRYTIAIGSNKEALKLSGVNVLKWHILAYMISGLMTGLAAVTYGRGLRAERHRRGHHRRHRHDRRLRLRDRHVPGRAADLAVAGRPAVRGPERRLAAADHRMHPAGCGDHRQDAQQPLTRRALPFPILNMLRPMRRKHKFKEV